MPTLLFARPPLDATEERQVRRLAGSRHAPGDWIRRAKPWVWGRPPRPRRHLRRCFVYRLWGTEH
jgi:hypothetical protein